MKKRYLITLLVIIILAGILLTSLYNYLLFHSLSEMFSVIVAIGIFIIFWNTRQLQVNSYFKFLGIAFLFIGIMDFSHTLAYKGMGVFPEYGTNLATQLWIATRYLQSLSLLAAPLFIDRQLKVRYLMLGYAIVVALLLSSIFYWQIFPVCYIEGEGLTPFKKISEYIISALLLSSVLTLFIKRKGFDTSVLRLLYSSILLNIAAEIAFTFYNDPFGPANLIGHLLKIVSFFLMYKAFIETGLVRPYNLLFRDLKRSEEEYRDLYEQAPNAYISVDTDGRIQRANLSASEILGYNQSEFIGRPVLDLYADTPGDKSLSREDFKRLLTSRETRESDIMIRRADGTPFWVNISVRPVRDNKGQVIASRSVIVDNSERKKVEELKDDFISLVSHELRSPMTVITGAISTALTEEERLTKEEKHQLLQDAALESELLSNILSNLLELSRIQANRLSLHTEAVNVEKLVNNVIGYVKRQSSGHQFVIDMSENLPVLLADELRLERILYNLTENAAKYSPPSSEIRISINPENNHMLFKVSDQGPGITLAEQEMLFAPFQRLEDTRRAGVRGVGLGLMVCRRLVEAHGGRIWIESEPGRGSTFLFTIPLGKE